MVFCSLSFPPLLAEVPGDAAEGEDEEGEVERGRRGLPAGGESRHAPRGAEPVVTREVRGP